MSGDGIAIVGATLIDGTGAAPLPDSCVVIEDGHIVSAGRRQHTSRSRVIDAAGKYVIPGLLDANVHLCNAIEPEYLLTRELGWYDDLVTEAAQVALRAGVTTVFDTHGPLASLRRVRDRINRGELAGSRIFCAGNIIGNGGPYSDDFLLEPIGGAALSPSTIDTVNQEWEQGVGGDLLWRSSEEVRIAVREYIATKDIDFVKYTASAHNDNRFIAFSPDCQRAIVEEAHAAGMTAQACTQNGEALKMAIEAGVDLLQHGDVTGRYPMPDTTLDLIVERRLPCVAFLMTERYMSSVPRAHREGAGWRNRVVARDENDRRLIQAGATLLLAHDMCIYSPLLKSNPKYAEFFAAPDQPRELGRSHIVWLRAALERGMSPMNALLSTTRNIAEAYGKSDELGTVESGKRADVLVLDGSPLDDVENYTRIAHLIKDGKLVDRHRLPEHPVLTPAH